MGTNWRFDFSFTNVDSCYKLVYYSYISIHLDGILLPETLREAPVDILSDEQADSAWGDSYNGNIHICVQDLDDFVYGACNVRIVTWTYAYKSTLSNLHSFITFYLIGRQWRSSFLH